VRITARRRLRDPAHRTGHRARHVLASTGGVARRRHRRDVYAARQTATGQSALRDLLQSAVRDGRDGLRVRFQCRRAPGPPAVVRLPEAASRTEDLSAGGFQPVIDDGAACAQPDTVRRLVFCTGKLYYDLIAARVEKEKSGGTNGIAIARVEELYPWPHEAVAA